MEKERAVPGELELLAAANAALSLEEL